jgi:hypothetical protein
MSQNRFDKLLKTAQQTQPPASEQSLDIQTSEHSDAQASKAKSSYLDVQTSEHLDAPASKAKSSSKEFKRTTLYLSQELHRLLKRASVDQGLEMSDIAEIAIRRWLEDKDLNA